MLQDQNNFDYIDHYKKDAEKFDYFEERFGATKDDERRLREYIIALVPKNPISIVDIGCGSGWVAEYFCKKGITVCSTDLSIHNVKKSLNKTTNKNHFGIVMDSFNPAIKQNKIEVIISSEVIEHVVKPDLFIVSLYNLLKKDGKLIISTPYKEILKHVLCIYCNNITPIHAHLHSFDENDFIDYNKNLQNSNMEYFIFGNKALIFLRTYTILKHFPFLFWKLIDKMFNILINKPAHFIVVYKKSKLF